MSYWLMESVIDREPTEKVGDRQLTEWNLTARELADRELTDRELTRRELTD